MDLTLITAIISISIGLISIFLGVWIIIRLEGKLKISIIFLILAVIIFVIKESFKLWCIDSFANSDIFRSALNIIMVVFITISIFNIERIINKVDRYYNHKKRKK